MKWIASCVAVAATLLVNAALAQTPSWTVPPESQRCPSKWGATDERGSANLMSAETVLNATKLIKTGEVIELAHVLSPNIPLGPVRRYEVITKRTAASGTSNNRTGNEEIVYAEIGQVGTQFDGFAHQGHGDSHYNCFKGSEISTRTGFKKLGIHNVGAFFTRGVLIDVAGAKGVEMLPDTYEITVQDLEDALKKQNLTLQRGDAVIIHTGWGKLYGKENARFRTTCPGIGVKARRASLGADEARRTGIEAGQRVRLHHAAVEARRRHRLDRLADRGEVIQP